MASFRTVKGFRDFFPEECALRNYIFETWRSVARRYGFVEYEAPIVESTDLYRKKSGDEITSQLFCFQDKADREISLRPEVTPSLARMATARQRDFKKPIKWFQIGSCFRYEEPQEGRTREFIQFNADILGDASQGTDAELIALSIDVMLAFGIKKEDFAIRLSNREIWTGFLKKVIPEDRTKPLAMEILKQKEILKPNRNIFVDMAELNSEFAALGGSNDLIFTTIIAPYFLQIIDKIERAKPEDTSKKLEVIGLTPEDVRSFMTSTDGDHPAFAALRADLSARGLWDYVKIDASIVRGLAYYTGTVFEVFDLKHGLRAVAGGGRYDKLCALMSDGHVDMPAAGFAMGDVVLGILLSKTPGAQMGITAYLNAQQGVDAYVVVADETQRANALAAVQNLRSAGLRVDFSFSAQKVGKQFQAAENVKARFALVFGAEYPQVQVKNLISRSQDLIAIQDLVSTVKAELAKPVTGPLIA